MITPLILSLLVVMVEGQAEVLSQASILPTISPIPKGGWLRPGALINGPQQLWLTHRMASEEERAPRPAATKPTVRMICGMPVLKADPEFDKQIVARAPPHFDEEIVRKAPCPE